jgi:hypothetical protein
MHKRLLFLLHFATNQSEQGNRVAINSNFTDYDMFFVVTVHSFLSIIFALFFCNYSPTLE